ncbi:hypothetical protein HHL16_13560 [Pseudoflavitalea sp. G-6-1-2]|uniref:hypothetical protein n=1 Tax=Pseudoflavitalea sp. G-6-1-2 TaxID=2728841 RepID=UPI00146C2EBC|nr:hypothetical protein [Pseudoflavitalea sp. G-6-1-2]NML21911.1 hypothetical protein [Pseudoflavitalea sp. G-6-1-2]
MFIILLLIGNISHAQNKVTDLEVYKIVYSSYTEPRAEDGEVKAVSIPKNEVHKFSLFAHSRYLLVTDRISKTDSSKWLVQYNEKKLWELRGSIALPLSYDDFLTSDVYLENEERDSLLMDYGILTFTVDTATIEGYHCKKAIIEITAADKVSSDPKKLMHIWYCPELPAAYWPTMNHLERIPGALLLTKYDRGYGDVECIRVKKITKQKKAATFFNIPKNMMILYPPSMN